MSEEVHHKKFFYMPITDKDTLKMLYLSSGTADVPDIPKSKCLFFVSSSVADF